VNDADCGLQYRLSVYGSPPERCLRLVSSRIGAASSCHVAGTYLPDPGAQEHMLEDRLNPERRLLTSEALPPGRFLVRFHTY